MTGRIEKTVFISYRRTNLPWALAIYQNLTANGYDVFFDYNSIKSGDFEQIITQNIKGRAHFVVLLTPSALERCNEPGDWLRREIELAIDEKRNVVSLFFEGFSFSSPSVSKHLIGKLKLLQKYNGMTVPSEYFDAAMTRLRNDFLNVQLSAVLHPISSSVEKAVKFQQAAASNATKVRQKELTAQEWVEKGLALDDNSDDELNCYTQAILLDPNNKIAYNNRGSVRRNKGDTQGAIRDYTEAIRLDQNYATPYYGRGTAHYDRNELDKAIIDLTESIRLRPDYVKAYYNRAITWKLKEDFYAAIADYQKYLDLGGGIQDGDQEEVEGYIEDLKKKIK